MSYEKHKAGLAVDCIKLEQTPIEKAIWSVLDEYCDAENHPLKEYDLVCDVLQKVEEAVSKCTFTGWIPCSERLPKPNEYDETGKFFKAYLVQDKRETMYTALWNGENWLLWTRNIRIENVIAWQPLPEPYKEEIK